MSFFFKKKKFRISRNGVEDKAGGAVGETDLDRFNVPHVLNNIIVFVCLVGTYIMTVSGFDRTRNCRWWNIVFSFFFWRLAKQKILYAMIVDRYSLSSFEHLSWIGYFCSLSKPQFRIGEEVNHLLWRILNYIYLEGNWNFEVIKSKLVNLCIYIIFIYFILL